MLFEECEDIGTDEIMNWDGICFKPWKLGWEEKLESDKHKLKSDKQELEIDNQESEDNLELAKHKIIKG